MIIHISILPIFGEFDNFESNDNIVFWTYSMSSSLSDRRVLEEIIYERINNNYQIIKPKSDNENGNYQVDINNSKYN